MKMPSFLITGGCGFIGTSIIDKLLSDYTQATIRVLDNFSTGSPDDLLQVTQFKVLKDLDNLECFKKVILFQGDIRDIGVTKKITKGIDCVIHLAANTGVPSSVENPRLDLECNVLGTFNMLEASRINGVQKFIFASSGAPAGEVEPPIHEELPPHPVSPYGASKLSGEGYCSAYYRTYGLNTICLRFGNVYGPRSKRKLSVVAKFIKEAIDGETCIIFGDGNQTRDFLFIDDLVEAVILCIEKDVGGETFQIATGMELTVNDVAGLIEKALHRRGINMSIEFTKPRLGDVKRNFSDTRKATRILGWKCKMDIKQGIEKTIEYFTKRVIT